MPEANRTIIRRHRLAVVVWAPGDQPPGLVVGLVGRALGEQGLNADVAHEGIDDCSTRVIQEG